MRWPASLGPAVDAARAIRAQALDLAEGLRRPTYREAVLDEVKLAAQILPAMVPWLLRARPEGQTTLVTVVREHAARQPDAVALEMGDERLTWRQVADQAAAVAGALAARGLRPGDTIALLGPNSPFYVVAMLGAAHLGVVAALINTNLTGDPLAHAIRTASARLVLAHQRLAPALDGLRDVPTVSYGPGPFDDEVRRADRSRPPAPVRSGDDFVYIYTSGTTGLPKPSKVSHGRTLMAGSFFAKALWRFQPGDKVYCVLPLYHSSGLMLGVGASFIGGVPVVLRESFSARAFWPDIVRHGATGILYIGEVCRHLLNSPPGDDERRHHVRVAVGNGMRADVWEPFMTRFGIPEIREFYGATEAPGGIFNLTGKVGSLGRLPLRHLLPGRLVRYDLERGEHVRDAHGFCVECGPGQDGEFLMRLSEHPMVSGFEFRGYTDDAATRQKILTDVFRPGDRYYRSGDLLRVDEDGFFSFVDRLGDTFRWKGENVSTTEVAEALARAPGVRQLAVVGVHVPGMEGQAGLAAVVTEHDTLDLDAFLQTARTLPGYARPRFVRLVQGLSTTGTHKIQKNSLRTEGVDPSAVRDPLYVLVDDRYEPLTPARWADLRAGRLRL